MSENVEHPGPVLVGGGLLDVAIWIDPVLLARISLLLRHLVMGLKSEGHQVSFIAGQELDLSLLPTLGSRVLTYRWNTWEKFAVMKRMRLAAVIAELMGEPPDVLLIWGSADVVAVEIVQAATGLPGIVWCWDASELFSPLMQLPHVRQAIVSSQPLADRVPATFRVPVALIHPGVYTDETIACYDVAGQLPCLVSLDPLSDFGAYEGLIRACRKMADDGLEFLVFAYNQGNREHAIWQLVQKLELLDRINFVPFQLDAEPLLLHGDLYLHVAGTNRVQYRTLEAMAKGLAVVTAPNAGSDYLLDGQTCRIVGSAGSGASAESWRQILAEMITDRNKASQVARRGQEHVRERHTMTGTLSQFTSVCRQAAGVPLKLSTATTT